jgi:hypothetical protein
MRIEESIMMKSSIARWMIGVIVVIGILGLIRFKPWQRGAAEQAASRQELAVGFLPVT